MMGVDLIAKIGKPAEVQRVSHDSFWYYQLDTNSPMFQVVLDSNAGEGQFGFVTEINRY